MEAAFALDVDPSGNWLKGSLVPDVAFVNSANIQEQKAKYADTDVFRVLPDLVVKVVSPSDSFSDVVRKVNRYLGYGLKLVWVVDPKNKRVHVFTPQKPDGHILSESDTLMADGIIPDWSMPI